MNKKAEQNRADEDDSTQSCVRRSRFSGRNLLFVLWAAFVFGHSTTSGCTSGVGPLSRVSEKDAVKEIRFINAEAPLTLLETAPEQGAEDVSPDVVVKFLFDEQLDRSLIEQAHGSNAPVLSVRMKRGEDGLVQNVSGSLSVEGPNLFWLPDVPLTPGTTYIVSLTTDLRAADGGHLQIAPYADALQNGLTDREWTLEFTVSHRPEESALNAGNPKVPASKGPFDPVFRVQGGAPGKGSFCAFVPGSLNSVRLATSQRHLYFNLSQLDRGFQFLIDKAEEIDFSALAVFKDQKPRTEEEVRRILSSETSTPEHIEVLRELAAVRQLPHVFTFQLNRGAATRLKEWAVPQREGRNFASRPQIVDFNHAQWQLGVPPVLQPFLIQSIGEGTFAAVSFFSPLWKSIHSDLMQDEWSRIRQLLPNGPVLQKVIHEEFLLEQSKRHDLSQERELKRFLTDMGNCPLPERVFINDAPSF